MHRKPHPLKKKGSIFFASQPELLTPGRCKTHTLAFAAFFSFCCCLTASMRLAVLVVFGDHERKAQAHKRGQT